jgi:lysophospholipase L1-like esterase
LVITPVGDSISAHCLDAQPWDPTTGQGGYCATLAAELDAAGVAYSFATAGSGSTPGSAVAGVGCSYWASHIHDVLVADNPDLVILDCGTNDNVSSGNTATFETNWRSIVDQIHAYRPADPVKVVAVFVQYSNPDVSLALGRTWLTASEPNINDAIYRNRARADLLADLQSIPPSLGLYTIGCTTLLLASCDGIHPTALGAQRMAQLIYRGIEGGMGWPDVVPQPCDMTGHRFGSASAEATYLPYTSGAVLCNGTTP